MVRNDNPYSAPQDTPAHSFDSEVQPPLPTDDLNEMARSKFLAWEKLRGVYVGVLAFVTIGMGGVLPTTPVLSPRFRVMAIAAAIPANRCYFAGPILETYVRWRGYPTSGLRRVLFLAGTLFAAFLAAGVVAGFSLT